MPAGFKGRLIRSTSRSNLWLKGRHRMAIDVVAQIGPDITLRGQRDNSLRRRRSRWRVALG